MWFDNLKNAATGMIMSTVILGGSYFADVQLEKGKQPYGNVELSTSFISANETDNGMTGVFKAAFEKFRGECYLTEFRVLPVMDSGENLRESGLEYKNNDSWLVNESRPAGEHNIDLTIMFEDLRPDVIEFWTRHQCLSTDGDGNPVRTTKNRIFAVVPVEY